MGVTDAFWRTPGTRVAANVPLLLDGQWVDAEPLPDDGTSRGCKRFRPGFFRQKDGP
jgi:hypothetical protein